jgi:hypothetical protein
MGQNPVVLHHVSRRNGSITHLLALMDQLYFLILAAG